MQAAFRIALLSSLISLLGTAGCGDEASSVTQSDREALARCRASDPPWRPTVRKALDDKAYEYALTVAGRCAELSGNDALVAELADAQVKWRLQDATNSSLATRHRLDSLNALVQLSPETAAKLPPSLRTQLEKQVAREADAEAKQLKAERKKRGVTIGMTTEQVLDSSWGKPRMVNSTTTAGGTHQQWVYDSGNYLYFENGKLTAIQN